MKKILALLVVFLTAFLGQAEAVVVNSVQNGSWSSGSTWSTGTVPAAADEVHIYHQVTYNTSLTVANQVLVHESASLRAAANSQDITVNAGAVFTATHTVTCRNLQLYGTLHIQNVLLVQDSFLVANNVDMYNGSVLNLNGFLRCQNFTTLAGSSTFINAPVGTLVALAKLDNGGLIDNDWIVSVEGNLVNNSGTLTGDGGNYYCYPTFTNNAGATVDCNGQPINICRPDGTYPVVNGSGYVNVNCVLLCNGPWPTPQPVVFAYFDGRQNGRAVKLNWATASELSIIGFRIMRAASAVTEPCTLNVCSNAPEFQEIGKMPAQGAGIKGSTYFFEDPAPVPGINWYRILVMENDGTETQSQTIEVQYIPGAPGIVVWPNPSAGVMNVRVTGKAGVPGKLRLFTVTGQKVWEEAVELTEGEKVLEMRVCDYAAGVYILEFSQAGAKTTQKLVFQK